MLLNGFTLGVLILASAAYITGALRVGFRRATRWRTAAWCVGAGSIAAALSPSFMAYAHADIRGHMLQHLALGMFAPIGLVLAAPVTLALRNLPRAGAAVLVRLLSARPVRWLSHPITAALLDIGAMFVLYLTPLYATAQANATLGAWLRLHFIVAGCLFTWSILGIDAAPHRAGRRTRLAVLFLAMAAHGALSKYMYLHGAPAGVDASFAARQQAAQLMYYGGDIAALLVAAAFFAPRSRRARMRRANI